MDIPPDGQYIEILGHKITEHAGSFKEFFDHLKKCESLEHKWNELKRYFIDYRNEKMRENCGAVVDQEAFNEVYGRYCIALSIDDILKKMDEIEG